MNTAYKMLKVVSIKQSDDVIANTTENTLKYILFWNPFYGDPSYTLSKVGVYQIDIEKKFFFPAYWSSLEHSSRVCTVELLSLIHQLVPDDFHQVPLAIH